MKLVLVAFEGSTIRISWLVNLSTRCGPLTKRWKLGHVISSRNVDFVDGKLWMAIAQALSSFLPPRCDASKTKENRLDIQKGFSGKETGIRH